MKVEADLKLWLCGSVGTMTMAMVLTEFQSLRLDYIPSDLHLQRTVLKPRSILDPQVSQIPLVSNVTIGRSITQMS